MFNRTWKELILGALTASALIGTFWFWKKVLPLTLSGDFRYQNFLLPLGAIVISAALFLLAALFAENKWTSYLFPGIGILGGILFNPPNYTTMSVGIISVLLAMSAIHRVRREYTLSLGFSLSKLSKAGLPLFFTIISLSISLLYLEHINDKNAVATLLPKSAFTALLGSLSKPLSSLTGLPSIQPGATVDETLASIVHGELAKQGIDIRSASNAEILQLIAKERNALATQYGIRVRGNEKISDVLYMMASSRITDLLGPYAMYLPIIAAAGFFFAFKTLTIPLYYLTLLFTFLLIKICIAAKLLKHEARQITVEKLTL